MFFSFPRFLCGTRPLPISAVPQFGSWSWSWHAPSHMHPVSFSSVAPHLSSLYLSVQSRIHPPWFHPLLLACLFSSLRKSSFAQDKPVVKVAKLNSRTDNKYLGGKDETPAPASTLIWCTVCPWARPRTFFSYIPLENRKWHPCFHRVSFILVQNILFKEKDVFNLLYLLHKTLWKYKNSHRVVTMVIIMSPIQRLTFCYIYEVPTSKSDFLFFHIRTLRWLFLSSSCFGTFQHFFSLF